MLKTKQKELLERTRKKYFSSHSSRLIAKQKRKENPQLRQQKLQYQTRPEENRKKEPDKKIITKIHDEKNPDKLKEQLEQVKKQGLDMTFFDKDAQRLKKMEKARNGIRESIRKLNSRKASATTKDAVSNIQSGHSDRALHDLKDAGQNGGLGNEISDTSFKLMKDAKILSKESGKHFDSVMLKMLKENSVPADTIRQQKEQDKSDKNLEKRKTQDTTYQQMIAKKLQDRKLRSA
jgi:hypothetical protein